MQSPGGDEKVEMLRKDPNSTLNCCQRWGVVDILDTHPHTELKKLSRENQQTAGELGCHTQKGLQYISSFFICYYMLYKLYRYIIIYRIQFNFYSSLYIDT